MINLKQARKILVPFSLLNKINKIKMLHIEILLNYSIKNADTFSTN